MGDEPWRNAAACRDSGVDFFAVDPDGVAAALACCRACPVRLPCLDTAMALQEAHGVWGGTTEQERRREFRRRGRDRGAAA